MRFLMILTAALTLSISAQAQKPSKKTIEVVDQTLDFALEQTKIIFNDYLKENPTRHPRTVKDGEMVTANTAWWTSGFYPGTMWFLYEYSGDEEARAIAEEMTKRALPRQFATNDHDVGFQINCSAGNGYRLTDNQEYRQSLITTAASLGTRFNPIVGCTRSWNNKLWTFPVIIDNMMNLELLCVASALSENPEYYNMAVSHADRIMDVLFREDNSSYHMVDFNPETGEIIKQQTRQGYADHSAWSRGQAWGLYGYTMMYRCTGDKKYLDHAVKIAEYILEHPRMTEDLIPYWDYDAPNIPEASRDASAGAVMASAFIELSTYLPKKLSKKYFAAGEKQVLSLAKAPYRSQNIGDNCGFLLTNSVGFMAHDSEVDAPLTYADYYLIEAMMRLKYLYEGKDVVTVY